MERTYKGRRPTYEDFEFFKRNTQHRLKNKGINNFLIELLTSNEIQKYWDIGNVLYARYLVALADYLCRLIEVDICGNFAEIRACTMAEVVYPLSVMQGLASKEECEKLAIPEFADCNIMEVDVFDVV